MPAGVIRRVQDTPSLAFLTAIEGVVVIDRTPPAQVQGLGTGEVEIVGEFEDGPFDIDTRLNVSGDLAQFGATLGYVSAGGLAGQNPCARSRKADGAVVAEYWNGNGFMALVNKAFAGLTIRRIDTSVGAVKFTREAFLTGKSDFSFALTSGQVLGVILDGVGPTSATFTGVAATIISADGVYPSLFAGGEQITFKIDGTTYQAIFLAADQTHAQVVARLNAAAGFTAFAISALKTRITGTVAGTAGNVQIVSLDAAVATATGFVAAGATAGTGNVGDISKVTSAEANTIVVAAVAGTRIIRDPSNNLRLIDTATPGTGTIKLDSGTTTALGFGFPIGVEASAATGADGSIPAGTQVQTGGGVVFVTMQSIAVTATSAGPYSVKVRHALDDGTGPSELVSTLTTLTTPLALGAFSVTNDLPIASALTEAAIDALYVTAIAATTATTPPTKNVNVLISARQSNAIRSALRANAPVASANGCAGRIAVVRPPLKTTRAVAQSTASQPGVGAYRDNLGRVVYSFPGVNTFVPQVAALGLSGGAGFTADGNVDVGFDSWAASLISQLNPEENPGQQTTFLQLINSVEKGNTDVQNLQFGDYEAFKAAGIAAFKQDGGDNFIQSGVTTVDITTSPQLAPISRRRMADFIEDSGARFLLGFIKKLARTDRKAAAIAGLQSFLNQLKSPQNPALSRIDDFAIDAKSGNTTALKQQGIFWIIAQVVLLPSLDVIVFDAAIGATVTITIRK